MNIQVLPHNIILTKSTDINTGEYNVTECVFEFSDEYDGLTKEAVFSISNNIIKKAILNNKCSIPSEVLEQAGNVLIGVFGYEIFNQELVLRYSPKPAYFNVIDGSFKEGNDPELPEPTEWEQVLEQINAAIEKTNNLDIEVEKSGNTSTVTITKKDETTKSVDIIDGQDGVDGKDAKINGVNTLTVQAGENISISQSGSAMTISATDTTDYSNLSNQPQINSVTLSGNKSLNDLGIQPAGNYITKAVNDLENYYKKTETFTKQEVNNLISAITTMDIQVVQTLPTEDISTTTIYLVPKTAAETNDAYDEYIYVSNAWEHIGSTEVDLTNYVTNTDYASNSTGGVVKTNTNYGTSVDSNGSFRGTTKTYEDYDSMHNLGLISKVTLENVIAGKGLVSNTDYGSDNTAGVIKSSSTYGTQFASTGAMYARTRTYEQYTNSTSPGLFIGKGTLENIITGKGLVSNTDYATSATGGVIRTGTSYGTTMASGGILRATAKTYEDYSSAGNYMFVSKGTLENVIAGKELDLKQLSTFDSTKTQVLKNINGTLTWVDE